MDFEKTARENHRSGMNCARSVYSAFLQVNTGATEAPFPRSEGGKCGAVLAAEQLLREMEAGSPEEFDREFISRHGSLMCGDLRGASREQCNDYVGTAAAIAARMTGEV